MDGAGVAHPGPWVGQDGTDPPPPPPAACDEAGSCFQRCLRAVRGSKGEGAAGGCSQQGGNEGGGSGSERGAATPRSRNGDKAQTGDVSPEPAPTQCPPERPNPHLGRTEMKPREPQAKDPDGASSSPGGAARIVPAPVSTSPHPSTGGTCRWDISAQKTSFRSKICHKQVPGAAGRGKDRARSRTDRFWCGTKYSCCW